MLLHLLCALVMCRLLRRRRRIVARHNVNQEVIHVRLAEGNGNVMALQRAPLVLGQQRVCVWSMGGGACRQEVTYRSVEAFSSESATAVLCTGEQQSNSLPARAWHAVPEVAAADAHTHCADIISDRSCC